MTKLERKIITFRPIAYLLRKSKQISIPGFSGIPVFDVMEFFFQQVRKIGFSERAAAISFNILMAIPAGLIFLLAMVPFIPASVHFEATLLHTLDDVIKDQGTYHLVASIISDFFDTHSRSLISFSVLFIIYFSSNAMMGIMHTFDRSYFEERSSRFMAKRWMAIKLTALLVLLVIASVILIATQGSIKAFVLERMGWDQTWIATAIDYSRWLIIFALTFLSIAFIYRFGPAVKNRWNLVSPGSILATVLVILVSWLFGVWVQNFGNYNRVYGSIGTVIIIMNVVYINSLILIIGFEVNVSITAIRARSLRRIQAEAEADFQGE